MTTLRRIFITREANDTWKCIRERESDGESATGLPDLEAVFDYIRAHDLKGRLFECPQCHRMNEPEGETCWGHCTGCDREWEITD